MGIIKGKTIDSLITPFSSDENYRTFLEAIDTALPTLQTVTISCTCANGVVSGTGTYTIGAKYSLICTPNEGYYFQSWTTTAGVPVSNAYVLEGTATADATFVASVSKVVTYEISADAVCGTVTGTGFYPAGKSVILTCVPTSESYVFKEWADGETANPRTIVASASKHFTAYCQPNAASEVYYNVEVAVNIPEAASVTGGGTFKRGEQCSTLQYQTNGISYYNFLRWSDGNIHNPHDPFYVLHDYVGANAITAIFEDTRHDVLVAQFGQNEHCSLSGSIGGSYPIALYSYLQLGPRYWFVNGNSKYITASVEDGYTLDYFEYYFYDSNGVRYPETGTHKRYAAALQRTNTFWYGNLMAGFGDIPLPAYETQMYVRAVAEPQKFHISADTRPLESGSVTLTVDGVTVDDPITGVDFDPSVAGAVGDVVVTVIPGSGRTFDGWYRNSVKVSAETTYSFNIVSTYADNVYLLAKMDNSNSTIVYFDCSQVGSGTVTATVDGETITSGALVPKGSKVLLSYDLNTHYEFTGWSGGPGWDQGYDQHSNPTRFTVPDNAPSAYNIVCGTQPDPDGSVIVTSVVPSGSAEISGYVEGQKYWEGDTVKFTATYNEQILQVVSWERSSDNTNWVVFSTEKNPLFVCPAHASGDTYYIRLTLTSQTCMFNATCEGATSITATVGGVTETLPYEGSFGDKITVTVSYDTVKYSGVRWIVDNKTENPRTFSVDTLKSSGGFTAKAVLVEKQKYDVVLSGTHCILEQSGTLGTYHEGESCTVKCIPEEGYRFVQWQTGSTVISTQAEYTFTVTGTTFLQALTMFDVAYYVTTDVEGTGSVRGAGGYTAGSNVEVNAYPEEGVSEFYGWYDNADPENPVLLTHNPDYTFTMPSNDVKLLARFSESTVSIGAITITGATTEMSLTGAEGSWVSSLTNIPKYSTVYFQVTVAHGYHWYHWDDDLSAMKNRVIVADKNFPSGSLTFTVGPMTYPLTLSGEHCTFTVVADSLPVDPSEGVYNIPERAVVDITCNPETGYNFNRWSDGRTVNPYPGFVMERAFSLTAYVVEQNYYDIILTSDQTYEGCSWTISPSSHIAQGTEVTITATASEESIYEFGYWDTGGTPITINPYTFTPGGNMVIRPVFNFKPISFKAFGNYCTVKAYVGSTDITSEVTGSGYSCVPGTVIMVVADPIPDCSWSGWEDGDTSNPRFFTVNKSALHTATAVSNIDGPYQIKVFSYPLISGIAPSMSITEYAGGQLVKNLRGSDPSIIASGDDAILRNHMVKIAVYGKSASEPGDWGSEIASWSDDGSSEYSRVIDSLDRDRFLIVFMDVFYNE